MRPHQKVCCISLYPILTAFSARLVLMARHGNHVVVLQKALKDSKDMYQIFSS